MQNSGAQIERPLAAQAFAAAQVGGLGTEADADALAVRNGDACVRAARKTREPLVIVNRQPFEHARQECPVGGAGLFLATATHAERAVREREQRFGLRRVCRRAFIGHDQPRSIQRRR